MAREKTGFDQDGFCLGCGVHQREHMAHEQHGETTSWWVYHCPDLSVPNSNRDDDPWAEDVVRSGSGVEALFDSYD